MPNEPQTPVQAHGTPAFANPPYNDWAFAVAAAQRRLIIRTVPRGSAVPSPQELAEIIRVYAVPKKAAVRELIDAAQAVIDATEHGSPEHLRLVRALVDARRQFR